MKIKNVNSKRLAILFLTGFVLVGTVSCNKQKSDLKETEFITEDNEIKETEISEVELNSEVEAIVSSEIKADSEGIEEIVETEMQEQSADDIMNDYINETNDKINEAINSEDMSKIKETVTSAFITLVDFIYYDKPIYGVTYDELSDATKQNVSESFHLVDSIIDECFPDYKETLFSKYNDLKDKVTNTAHDKLGDDNWNQLGNAKENFSDSLDDIGDVVEDLTESGKTKVKTWYEQYRENHQ